MTINLEDRLPRGSGFLVWHHGAWWVRYRDENARLISAPTGTQDREQAVGVLAKLAIRRLEERIQLLQEIAGEAPTKKAAGTGGQGSGRTDRGARHKGRDRSVPANPQKRAQRKRASSKAGAQR